MLTYLFPTELLLQIFQSCTSIADVLNLALTCRRFHGIFASSQKLPLLAYAAEAEYGPLKDIIQLVTQNSSQPAHMIREAPLSMNLLQQIVAVGRVAKKWEEIYPVKKWKIDFEDRRLLTDDERYTLRRAIYRLWLYSRSFHSPFYPRASRAVLGVVRERAELLHNWSTGELAEMEDTRLVIREVVQNHICPSNGTIQRKFHKRFPENAQSLSFNIHLNYPPLHGSSDFHFADPYRSHTPPHEQETFFLDPSKHDRLGAGYLTGSTNKYATKFRSDLYHDPGIEGWGDEIPHYYVVEDMLKLDPGQVIWLRENARLKEQVERYVKSIGDWFENNGETFGQTLEWVINERGEDLDAFKDAICDQELGIAKTGF
ncbi:F-box domain-containing protein [Arthroderma uncinatum]|uniref:F-box domain-containing protein n=1 Tax=Arthroderma uncinatum TaxID=74035 RepID=UPI00144A6137|nr:F-box domain-containing protein [Arthroderma uncinatum]KAF3479825.1 F-box domain-containing protein [Arthroderma uncinatum]